MRFVMLMYPGPDAATEKSPIPDGPEAAAIERAQMEQIEVQKRKDG